MFSVYGDDSGKRGKHASKATIAVSVLAHVAAIGGLVMSARYAEAKPVKEVVITETPKDFQEIEKEVETLRLKNLWRYIQRNQDAGIDTHEVVRGERPVELTQREFELLEYLMRNERIVVPRQRLLEEVWGYDPFATTNTIEVFVSNLRRKLEAGGEPRLLHTIRGAGYVLRA